jgi:thymidylate synthase ThyX
LKQPKTHIKAELLLASKNAITRDVLYTFRLTYPRIILAEFNTHRVFSRSTSSGRAIPMKRMRKAVITDAFIPQFIGAAQKGMQAGAEIRGWKRTLITKLWSLARYPAVATHWVLEKLGAPKQIANRLLEPWLWTVQIASATDLKNFIKLRTHVAAEPHFRVLAEQVEKWVDVADAMFSYLTDTRLSSTANNRFQILQPSEWHVPLIQETEWVSEQEAKLISAARCARTSYTLIEDGNKPTLEKDIELGQKLVAADPIHASPLEHQARAMRPTDYPGTNRWGNFRGFRQFRYEIPGEAGGDVK